MFFIKSMLAALLIGLSFSAQAQQIPRGNQTNGSIRGQKTPLTQDVIYLKNGSVIKGKIVERNPEQIKVEIQGGSLFVFNTSEITEIKQEERANGFGVSKPKNYHQRDSGFYQHVQLKINGSRNYYSNISLGVGINYTAGWQFNKYAGVGLNLGYEGTDGYRFIPLLVDFRGSLGESNTRFYYNLAAGYGFARTGTIDYNAWSGGFRTAIEAKGGQYIYPAVGVKFASTKRAHFTVDFGYTFNKASYVVSEGFGSEPYSEERFFTRTCIRLGICF